MSEFAGFWEELDAARKGTKFGDLNKLLAAIGSDKGMAVSRSTWYSYQRWFRGGHGTSPTVSFLSRVASLLRLTLVLGLRPSGSVTTPSSQQGDYEVKDIEMVVEMMTRLDPEARRLVRNAVLDKIAELAASPPDGGDENGRRPPPT